MNTKLILLDLDNTLLNSSQQISVINQQALLRCKALGHHIGIITARSPRKVGVFLRGLPCDCIAFYNGAMAYAGDLLLEKHVIAHSVGIAVMRGILDAYPRARIGAYLEPYSYFDGELRQIATGRQSSVDIEGLPQADMQRIRVVFDPVEGFSPDVVSTTGLRCYLSAHGSAVIVHLDANKGHALRVFADHFNVPVCDVIAFGDDTNDIEMLRAAGIGVSMANAQEAVKSMADAITGTNDADGVAQWLLENLLR